MSYFWCELHNRPHLQGADSNDCLLVGPYQTAVQAKEFGLAHSADRRCEHGVLRRYYICPTCDAKAGK